MKYNMNQWLNEWRSQKIKKSMPILSFPAVQLMGVSVRDLISSSDIQAKGMKMVADRVPSAAAVSLMDLSLEAECFGSKINFSDDEVPTVIGSIVNNQQDADSLKIPPIGAGRTSIYIEAIEKAVKMIDDRPLFAGVIGPFSLAGRLMDVSEIMIYCYEEPEMVTQVLEKVTEFLISYINAYKQAGANGVVIAEPLAGLLSPRLVEEFSGIYCKKIIDAVQTENFAVIYHNCGSSVIDAIDSILAIGAKGYHFGNAIDMEEMLKKVPRDVLIMGNIDPATQFFRGTPASMKEDVVKLLDKCSKYSNYILSSGCDIPPQSSWENIDAYFAAVEEYYQKQNAAVILEKC